MPVRPAKAETLMGRAFRDHFDKVTFEAVLRIAPHWSRREHMVRSIESGYSGGRMFRLVAMANHSTGETLEVHYGMTAADFAQAGEELFEEIGARFALELNRQIEQLYMTFDEDEDIE